MNSTTTGTTNTAKKTNRLTYRDGWYIWIGSYRTRSYPRNAGLTWSPLHRLWMTKDSTVARRLWDKADSIARSAMGKASSCDVPYVTRQAALTAVKRLAAVCDYADKLDGTGFDKSDAVIGHELARCTNLTSDQAAMAIDIALRHKRQLPDYLVLMITVESGR